MRITLVCLLGAFMQSALAAPLCPVHAGRSVEDTLDAITASSYRDIIVAETDISIAEMRTAQQEGRLAILPCGNACDGVLRTSRIKNGTLVYVRRVRSEEPVLWITEHDGSLRMLVLPYCCQTLRYDTPLQHNVVRFGPEQYTPCVGVYGYGAPCINSSPATPFEISQ